jgi:serine phosphatase RsbU (regulator of sigma subunit)
MEIWGGNGAFDSALSVPGIDAWVYSQPYAGDPRGGDIHYVSTCGHGQVARFVVADVAGHGQTVGELAGTLRTLMRKHINQLDQTKFVQALGREFSALAETGAFATSLLASYFAGTDHLVLCNAGHPRPLWYRASDSSWHLAKHDIAHRVETVQNLPLGVVPDTEYYQFAVKLDKGDLVLIYTDSLIEAMNADGKPLGEEGLLALARSLDPARPETFNRELLAAVAEYRNQAPPEDDVTAVLLHHNAADPPKQSMVEMVKVLGKMMGLVKV